MIMRAPVLFAAPHRVMFLAGTIQALACVMGFWSLELGRAPPAGLWPMPSVAAIDWNRFPHFGAARGAAFAAVCFLCSFSASFSPPDRVGRGPKNSTRRDFIPAFLLLCLWLAAGLGCPGASAIAGGGSRRWLLGGWMAVALVL
jgi:hypothetical protein